MKFCLFLILLVSVCVAKSNLRMYSEDPIFVHKKQAILEPAQPRFEEVQYKRIQQKYEDVLFDQDNTKRDFTDVEMKSNSIAKDSYRFEQVTLKQIPSAFRFEAVTIKKNQKKVAQKIQKQAPVADIKPIAKFDDEVEAVPAKKEKQQLSQEVEETEVAQEDDEATQEGQDDELAQEGDEELAQEGGDDEVAQDGENDLDASNQQEEDPTGEKAARALLAEEEAAGLAEAQELKKQGSETISYSELPDVYDHTIKVGAISNYAKEDLLTQNDPWVEQLVQISESTYNDQPQIYHNMVPESLTSVVTAGKTDTQQRLWDRFEDEKDRHYKDVHYNRPTGALTETVTDKEGNAYEIDYAYKNWPTPVIVDKPVNGVQVDKILEGTSNPIKSRVFDSTYQHEVIPNPVE